MCSKTVKRNPNYQDIILCRSCAKIEFSKKYKKCLNCDTVIKSWDLTRKYCSKSCSSKHSLKGRTLSREHRENLSKSAWNNKGNGYAKVKYYKIYCPYMKKIISVQGTYELKYATFLNNSGIRWERNKNISLRYTKNDTDINRNYYPDFYLVDSDEFIEIKGYFSPNDKIKMDMVKTQNPTKNIKILFKEDLESLWR
jgi:hypothetical protein